MKDNAVSSDSVVRRNEKCGVYTTLLFGYAVNCMSQRKMYKFVGQIQARSDKCH